MPIWDPDALNDLMEVVDYIARDDPVAAWRVHDEIYDRADVLDEQPKIGRPGLVHGTREFVLSGTPFILIYRSDPVVIVRVLHGAQQWPPDRD